MGKTPLSPPDIDQLLPPLPTAPLQHTPRIMGQHHRSYIVAPFYHPSEVLGRTLASSFRPFAQPCIVKERCDSNMKRKYKDRVNSNGKSNTDSCYKNGNNNDGSGNKSGNSKTKDSVNNNGNSKKYSCDTNGNSNIYTRQPGRQRRQKHLPSAYHTHADLMTNC